MSNSCQTHFAHYVSICSFFVPVEMFVFRPLAYISTATIFSVSFTSSYVDLSSKSLSTSSHIWLLCVTMVMTLLEGQRWPFSLSSQRQIFRHTVCELYPRHPVTKDSCILKAAGDPWQTTEGPKLMKERKNCDKKVTQKVIKKLRKFFKETSFTENTPRCRTRDIFTSTKTGGRWISLDFGERVHKLRGRTVCKAQVQFNDVIKISLEGGRI